MAGDQEQTFAAGSSSSSLISSEASQSPYFLHHSDTSNLVLVSELLTDENYITWSRSMLLALSIRNKLGFIDGTLTQPTGPLLSAWIRNNHIVIAWILNSVSKGISSSILFSDSARSIWLDLKERFQRKNGPRIFQLKRSLATLTQDQHSVTMYFSQLKSIWDEYTTYRPACTCGKCSCGGTKDLEEFHQYEYLMSFLMGLNESYGPARSQILLMDPPPPVNKAMALIAQEEQQRSLPVLSPLSANHIAAAKERSSSKDGNSNNPSGRQKKDRPICTNCGISGHTIDRCYRLHGFPPGYRQKGGQRNQQQHQTSSTQFTGTSPSNTANVVANNGISTNSTTGESSTGSSNTLAQCHEILTMLQTKLAAVKTESDATTNYLAGQVHFANDWQG